MWSVLFSVKTKAKESYRGKYPLVWISCWNFPLHGEPELLFSRVFVKFHSVLPTVLRELCFFYFQCLIFDGRR